MRVLMPWYLPFAAGIAVAGTRLGREQRRSEGGRLGESLFLHFLTWFPLLCWLIAQLTSSDPRHP